MLHWTTAVQLARRAEDLTHEEWCGLYVDMQNPKQEQVEHAAKVAYEVLVRKNLMDPHIVLDTTIR